MLILNLSGSISTAFTHILKIENKLKTKPIMNKTLLRAKHLPKVTICCKMS